MEHMIRLGLQFGYPSCCISAFLERADKYFRTGEVDPLPLKLDGTGYVPCLVCNQKSEAELIGVIQANRTYPEPFPNDSL